MTSAHNQSTRSANMSVSAVGSAPPPVSAPSASAVSQTARAADGDYLVKSSATSSVKDSDGDYKPSASSAVASSPASMSSNATQAAVANLKLGG